MKKLLKFIASYTIVGVVAGVIVVFILPRVESERQPAVTVSPAPAIPNNFSAYGVVSYKDAVGKAAPAVVSVHTAKIIEQQRHPLADDPLFRYFFGNGANRSRPRVATSLGSGVIFDTQGYVITNHHVIAEADQISVVLTDGRTSEAQIVGTDVDTDLAVLKINLANLPSVAVRDSSETEVGDVVLAIGNPFGVGQTVTQGIISAKGRSRLGISTYEDFMQTDAAINPGNSGGALIDANGNLVGINTAIFSRSGGSMGIGFAIPSMIVKRVLIDLVAHGRVVRGWLGVEAQDITPQLAQSFGLDAVRGVVVAGVLRGGPADNAGLKPGDILLEIDGQPITDTTTVLSHVASLAPGQKVVMSGLKAGKPFTTEATVMERPKR